LLSASLPRMFTSLDFLSWVLDEISRNFCAFVAVLHFFRCVFVPVIAFIWPNVYFTYKLTITCITFTISHVFGLFVFNFQWNFSYKWILSSVLHISGVSRCLLPRVYDQMCFFLYKLTIHFIARMSVRAFGLLVLNFQWNFHFFEVLVAVLHFPVVSWCLLARVYYLMCVYV